MKRSMTWAEPTMVDFRGDPERRLGLAAWIIPMVLLGSVGWTLLAIIVLR